MQFDANMMKAFLEKSDSDLWQTVRAFAEQNGIKIPSSEPSAADMARLRAVLAGKSHKDVGEALEILRRARGY